MMEHPKILALIPAYNSAEYVEKAIKSLLQQDYPDLRILVMDDCSSDGTPAVAHGYGQRVEIARNHCNLGFFGSLNQGLALARDEDFVLVHQDDVELIDGDYLSRALEHFNGPNVGVVCGQATNFSRKRLSLDKRVFSRLCAYDYVETAVAQATFTFVKADLFRMSALRYIGGFSYEAPYHQGLVQEDQIIAQKLRENGYLLIKDPSLRYQLDYARTEGLWGFLLKEAGAGKDLGIAIGSGMIDANPKGSGENRVKRNFRWSQIITVTAFIASLLLIIWSIPVGIGAALTVIILRSADLNRRAYGFLPSERLYFIGFGLLFDVVAGVQIYIGIMLGIFSRLRGFISPSPSRKKMK